MGSNMVFVQGGHESLVLAESLNYLLSCHTKCLEQNADRLLALAVNANCYEILLIDLEFKPGTAARDQLGDVDIFVGGLIN